MTETIDIIYCYRNRDAERVRVSLQSLSRQEDKRFSVTFVDYGSNDEFSDKIKDVCSSFDFCSYFYINARGKMWNRGDALNHGVLLSKSSHLFFSDIDMIFMPGFIEKIQLMRDDNKAHFFSVGYLNAGNTSKAAKGKTSKLSYWKSEQFATGMVMASRNILNTVNGYNTFYCLWGLEDNDLRRRIELCGFKCHHVDEVLMLHQYHASATSDNSLPEGWIQFMKDHFSASEKQKVNHAGITQSLTHGGRPAEEQFKSGKLHFKEIKARKLFLRFSLLESLQAPGVHTFRVKPTIPEQQGFIQKNGQKISNFLRKIGIHAEIRSPYHDQYISIKEIIDEIYFVIKAGRHKIADYYINETDRFAELVVITR